MKASTSVCLFLALLASGTALQCEVCTALGHNCTGGMETCPPDHDFCGITLFESEREEVKVKGIIKNCLPTSACEGGSAVMNLGKKGRSRTNAFCCKGDACNTALHSTLPPTVSELNGLRCPACYASSSESCNEDTVSCAGSEYQCIDLAGYVDLGETSETIAMKGCATQTLCAASTGGAAMLTGISSSITKLECRVASSTANVFPALAGLFLSTLAGLLLVKFGF